MEKMRVRVGQGGANRLIKKGAEMLKRARVPIPFIMNFLFLLVIGTAAAFSTTTTFQTALPRRASFLPATHQLAPEPSGGTVLIAPISLNQGSMMKDMGDGSFWLQFEADGDEIKKLRNQVLRVSIENSRPTRQVSESDKDLH